MTLSPTRLMEISKNIQEARLKQRKTTEDMAECIGISASYYCQIEAGMPIQTQGAAKGTGKLQIPHNKRGSLKTW